MSGILVVDDQRVYRAGLRDVIQARFPGVRVVDSPKLSDVGAGAIFDLILIDSDSLSYESLDLLAEIYEVTPTTRVAIMLTTKARADVLNYLSAGFHGVLDKLQGDEELLSAIGDLLSGRIYVPGWLADADDEDLGRPSQASVQQEALKLTPRQNEVLHLLARGMSNKEVARELNIAEGTCKIHAAALLRALGARNRTEAAFMAAKLVSSSDRAARGITERATGPRERLTNPVKKLKGWCLILAAVVTPIMRNGIEVFGIA